MSELRIRSETVPDEDWVQPFLPPAARDANDPLADGEDFGPLLAAAGRALTVLFGLAVTVRPGRPPVSADRGAHPRVAPVLAGLLATLRFGGDPARTTPATPATAAAVAAGVALGRHAAAIVAVLDSVAASDWPATCQLREFDLDIGCAGIEGHASVLAPSRPLPPPPQPILALRDEVLGLPMRIRVELAAEMRLVSSLLPLRAGQVLAIAPPTELPLILGRHCIGRAIVTPQPDGRQHAELVAIAIEPVGDRP